MQGSERYVIGIDSSTQSVKAIAWTRDGTPRAEGRAAHTISTPLPLHAEQNAQDWWTAAAAALGSLTQVIDPSSVDGLAISNQRETMVFLDEQRNPLAPATLWLDRRAQDVVSVLAQEIGPERLHAITGKPIDVIPCVTRLRYFREHQPELLDRAHQILGVHEYLTLKLTGAAQASWTSADPFGIFDIQGKTWSRIILDHVGVAPEKLAPLHRPGALIGHVTPQAAAATNLLPGTRVYAGGGDGNCAGLGVNAIGPGVVYLNLGTAVVGGCWSINPALSRFWRTLVSPDGNGYLLESCQRGGAYFVNWLIDSFAGGRNDPAVFARLENEARNLEIGSGGVTALPYLVGCMDPHWDTSARAGFIGLGPETGIAHVYRAALEAITLEFTRSLAEMRRSGAYARRISVIGGGAQSQLWRQMVADATGLPVVRSLSNEASALGSGMSAAVGAGWYSDFNAAAVGMSQLAEEVEPNHNVAERWEDLSTRQGRLYDAVRSFGEPVLGGRTELA
jgi:xylulokinase